VYVDVSKYVETCNVCQLYSKVQHKDGLVSTYPFFLHNQWAVDVVHVLKEVRGAQHFVLAIEDLLSYSKCRVLT
jgi:hypothetical protein